MSLLTSGTILRERYEIVGLIGTGGMGAVYLASDQRLEGRQCAVKEQVLEPVFSQMSREQFHQEASILARLDHPGLPKVSDYFSDDDRHCDYLVMDYVPGQNLEQLVQQARRENRVLVESVVLGWVEQLCDVLNYLHTRQPIVLHRDIKPANIKLTPDNRLKLVDFGLAKPFDPADPRTITGLQGLGSLPYTPLEQYVGHLGHTDQRADVYALGATCYHLLGGEPPASAHSRFLTPHSLIPLLTLNPGLSLQVAEAIDWAMRLHPDDRPPSVEVWQAVLQGKTSITPAVQGNQAEIWDWQTIWHDNALLIGIAVVLFVLALVITVFG